MTYKKLLNFVPAMKNMDSTGLPALRQPISNALYLRMVMSEYLEFEQLSEIDDLLKLRVKGGSSGFAGIADCYVNEDQFKAFCTQLIGFPKAQDDSVRFCSGESEQLSYFEIDCSCVDSSGRILVAAQIVCRDMRYPREKVCFVASFSFKVEPAAFDRFVSGLPRVSVVNNVGSKAVLVNEI